MRPDPPRVLLVAPHASEARLAGLVQLIPPDVETVLAGPAPPDPAAFGAIVVDQAPGPEADDGWLMRLETSVERGASLLVLVPQSGDRRGGTPGGGAVGGAGGLAWCDWLGVAAGEPLAWGEWFAKVAVAECGITDRIPPEFPIVDAPAPLMLSGGESISIVQVNVAYHDLVVLAERRLGRGRVTTCGLGNGPAALRHPELVTMARRSLLSVGELSRRRRPVGMGVVGYGPYGGMGLYHGLAAQSTPGLEMLAACDPDPGRRKAAAGEFPDLRAVASLEELLCDDDVTMVVVATPPASHFEIAREAIAAGKHVVLEKPMCLTVAEADALIEDAGSAGTVLTVHQSRRWDGDYLAVRRAVEEGLLGEVFNVETFVGGFAHPCRAWHSDVSISGGAVYDWGSHHLDWILQLMGSLPSRLHAHGHKRVWRDVTNLDQVRVRLEWDDGREAEFLQSDIAAIRRPKFFVQGTAGTLSGHYRPIRTEVIEPGLGYVQTEAHHAEAPVTLTLATYRPGYGVVESSLPPVPAARYGFHRNLVDHLVFGEPLAVPAREARDVVVLLEAAQRSTDEGNVPVTLDGR